MPDPFIDMAAPWPDMPIDIQAARLDFDAERLLASAAARAVPLPPKLAMARPRRRADYVAGRLCAQRACDALPARADNGAPVWPEGLTGSISHADGRAIALAASTARHGSIGVDVESLMTAAQARTLMPLILTAGERTRFAEQPPGLLATLAFSLKEALFKALHPLTGTLFFHEHAELVALEPDGRATLRLLTPLSAAWQPGARIAGLWHNSGTHIFSLVMTDPE